MSRILVARLQRPERDRRINVEIALLDHVRKRRLVRDDADLLTAPLDGEHFARDETLDHEYVAILERVDLRAGGVEHEPVAVAAFSDDRVGALLLLDEM